MASLEETQRPFLERDVKCGMVPPRHEDESVDEYTGRLAATYGLPMAVVREILAR
jgi:hypothetical protein